MNRDQQRADAIGDARVRATIALEHIARTLPNMPDEWHTPATSEDMAAALEWLQAELPRLIHRAAQAEAVVEGVTQALETLFSAVPRRWVPGTQLDRPEGTVPPDSTVDRWDNCGRPGDHGPHLGGDGTWNCRGISLRPGMFLLPDRD